MFKFHNTALAFAPAVTTAGIAQADARPRQAAKPAIGQEPTQFTDTLSAAIASGSHPQIGTLGRIGIMGPDMIKYGLLISASK